MFAFAGEHIFTFPGNLKIIYEVVSIDSWQRERLEGYAMYSMPFIAGRYYETVRCYRDLGDDTWLKWLERYFIGGRRRTQLNGFHGIEKSDDKQQTLNRYGNCTHTTGSLNIIRNVIIQKNMGEIDSTSQWTTTDALQRSERKSQKLTTISSILLAYHRAREKLEAIADINDDY